MKIFEQTTYRPIIREFIAQQPRKGRGLVKAIAQYLGVDPSYVSQVLSEAREFSEEQAILIAQFMGLNNLEADYFLTLVMHERAGSKLLKDHYQKKSRRLKKMH